jgi:hypothetical protein
VFSIVKIGSGAGDIGPIDPDSGRGAEAVFYAVEAPEIFVAAILMGSLMEVVVAFHSDGVGEGEFDFRRVLKSSGDFSPANSFSIGSLFGG